jgi:hypothetical protein
MSSLTTLLPWTLAIGLGALGVGAFAQNRDLARRIEALESAPASHPAPRGAPGASPEGPTLVVGGGPVLKADLDALAKQVQELRTQVVATSRPTAGGAGASPSSRPGSRRRAAPRRCPRSPRSAPWPSIWAWTPTSRRTSDATWRTSRARSSPCCPRSDPTAAC